MKKLFIIPILIILTFTACTVSFASEGAGAEVYVTVFDSEGTAALAYEAVRVSDCDGDGALTLNDALFCAHEQFYEGGAAAGYASSKTEYGLSLNKLWGDTNNGAFGYVKNNTPAMSLSDGVKEGDYIAAYAYSDLDTYSDTYAFFDKCVYDVKGAEEITLVLKRIAYDENWNATSDEVAGAKITVNGKATDFVTDENGSVTITLDVSGEVIIGAESDELNLVGVLCRATVASDNSAKPLIIAAISFGVALILSCAFIIIRRLKK